MRIKKAFCYCSDNDKPVTDQYGTTVIKGDGGWIGKDYQWEETVQVSDENDE